MAKNFQHPHNLLSRTLIIGVSGCVLSSVSIECSSCKTRFNRTTYACPHATQPANGERAENDGGGEGGAKGVEKGLRDWEKDTGPLCWCSVQNSSRKYPGKHNFIYFELVICRKIC